MKKRVGIPRAMGYYYLYPFFKTLLTDLGAEVVLSPPTTMATLEHMDVCPTDEPCLAVKLYFSHADNLASRKDIDFLFLPIIARVQQSWCCPKFIGVADMTRHGLQLPPERVLMPVLDYSDDNQRMRTSLQQVARQLGVDNPKCLAQAISHARKAQQQFTSLCVSRQMTTTDAFRFLDHGVFSSVSSSPTSDLTIAVIGHPYLLYEVVSQGMIERLRHYGQVLTAEMIDAECVAQEIATIDEGPRLWPFEAMLLGAALHLLRRHKVDKIILVGSFECGPESMIESYIEDEAHRQGIPFMQLALDEHSGEAGLTTRIEAFMDTEKTSGQHNVLQPTPHISKADEMILGFPSMGHLDIAIRRFVESFGVRTIQTPRTTQTSIELGREIAPEFVCFPFIATLGQMRYMLEHGANTLLMVGGKGFCRLGWYAQVQERLLRNMGYEFDLIIIDSPLPVKEKWTRFQEVMKRISAKASWPHIINELYTTYQHLAVMDRADAFTHKMRAFERTPGTIDAIVRRYLTRLTHIDGLATLRKLERDFLAEVQSIETEDTNPIRIRITGEIWVVLEQNATRDVERWLGSRSRPRVWIDRELSASNWFNVNVLRHPGARRRETDLINAAKPWLSNWVGGHGQITVGEVSLARKEGMEGIIHIFPFTCMPEIIAQNLLVRMAEEFDLPILTYIVSEQTGEAGMETRLESFLDLLEERRYAGKVAPVYSY